MNVLTKIDSFSGEWAFLSNFYPAVITYEGVTYATLEHAYQAAKTLDLKKREVLSLAFNPELHPAQAKRIGRKLKIRADWEEIKIGVMRHLLIQKFLPMNMRSKLLSTLDAELVEGNWWHDEFWGMCMGRQYGHTCYLGPHEPSGENYLGRLLMEVRSLLAMLPLPEPEPSELSDSTPVIPPPSQLQE